jgi:hypothetical protein
LLIDLNGSHASRPRFVPIAQVAPAVGQGPVMGEIIGFAWTAPARSSDPFAHNKQKRRSACSRKIINDRVKQNQR